MPFDTDVLSHIVATTPLWPGLGAVHFPVGGWLQRAMEGPTASSAVFYDHGGHPANDDQHDTRGRREFDQRGGARRVRPRPLRGFMPQPLLAVRTGIVDMLGRITAARAP